MRLGLEPARPEPVAVPGCAGTKRIAGGAWCWRISIGFVPEIGYWRARPAMVLRWRGGFIVRWLGCGAGFRWLGTTVGQDNGTILSE